MEQKPNQPQPAEALTFDILGLDPSVEQDRWIIDEAQGDPYMAWLLLCKEDLMGAQKAENPVGEKQHERTMRHLSEEIARREEQLGIRQIPE